MDETGETEQVPYTYVSVAEAAELLGVSVVTIRHMIESGRLEAERVHRPQGSASLVTLPRDGTPADAMTGLIQASIGVILGPLVAELGASRQTVERQAETIGRQADELDALRAPHATVDASGATESRTRT
jgi:excisionase family DNA binding protein